MNDDDAIRDLRADLGRLIRQLVVEEQRSTSAIGPRLSEHLGVSPDRLPVFSERYEGFDLPNIQLALDALLAQPGWGAEVLGVSGHGKRYSMVGLSDLLLQEHWEVGPPEHINMPVGPSRVLACIDFGVFLITSPAARMVLFLSRGEEHTPGGDAINVQVVSTDEGSGQEFLADVREQARKLDVFRGQVITLESTPMGGSSIAFVERPVMSPDELVLPDGVLEKIDRHIVGPTRHRGALKAAGRHLGRGLLLWGPPGTGKTHTVRYLTSLVPDTTVILLSGGSLGMVGAFGTLARRLAPSLILLEDVDLVAEERTFGPFGGGSPVLFELMEQMSGHAEDADIAFVLTTNRPDALEPALAARPGRVDLAVEIPLPDSTGRRRLLALYGRGLDLRLESAESIVQRTEGVSASFFKELLRKAALGTAEAGRVEVTQQDVDSALDELLTETARLTRVLLGAEKPDQPLPPSRRWMEGYPGVDVAFDDEFLVEG